MTDTTLPTLPKWQARSFWLTAVSAASAVALLSGIDLPAVFGVEGQEAIADHIMSVVVLVAPVWSWYERRNPKKALV